MIAGERFELGPAQVLFTTRAGGVSTPPYASLNLSFLTGDDAASVAENRRRAVTRLGGDPGRAAGLRQVHGARIREADEAGTDRFLDGSRAPLEGDGLVTSQVGVTLAAFGADCTITAIVATGPRPRVAVVHAGWTGLLAGALEAAVAAVGDAPACVLGPSAGPCCYEVREDVAAPLKARFGDDAVVAGRADLWRCAERALRGAGASQVTVLGRCTICDSSLFSHRRDGAPGGRQAVLALLEDA